MGGALIDLPPQETSGSAQADHHRHRHEPSEQELYAKAGKRSLESGRMKLYTGDEGGGDEHGARA